MRRALCPAVAIAVHGERQGEPAVYQHLGSRAGKDFDKLSICNLHRTLVSDQISAQVTRAREPVAVLAVRVVLGR